MGLDWGSNPSVQLSVGLGTLVRKQTSRDKGVGGEKSELFVILTPCIKSVLIIPGNRQFTGMPLGMSSIARDLERPNRAVLLVL